VGYNKYFVAWNTQQSKSLKKIQNSPTLGLLHLFHPAFCYSFFFRFDVQDAQDALFLHRIQNSDSIAFCIDISFFP
jgi:hypothetical protein